MSGVDDEAEREHQRALEIAQQALGPDGASEVAGALKFAADHGYFGRRPRRPGRPKGSRDIPDAPAMLDEYRRIRTALGRPPKLDEFAASYRHLRGTGVHPDTVKDALDRFGMAWPLDPWL